MQKKSVFHQNFAAMGTRFDAVFAQTNPQTAQKAFEALKTQVLRLEKLMNRFDSESPLAQLNQQAARQSVKTDPELWHILERCKQYNQATLSAFDPGLYALSRLWGIEHGKMIRKTSPEKAEIQKTLRFSGIRHVKLEQNHHVSFASPSVELDLGAFAKGYALDKIKTLLAEFSIENAILSFGESSVLALGRHPAGNCWKIGIENIFATGSYVASFSLSDQSLSTSGLHPSALPVSPQNYGHVLSPFTGCPVHGLRSVAVAAPSATCAEVLSTAMLVLPRERFREIKTRFDSIRWAEIEYSETGKATVFRH